MPLTIHSVQNGNTPLEEIVWLETDKVENSKGYAIVDRTFNQDGTVSNEFRHIYVFPSIQLKPGDYIRLCTGVGNNRVRDNKRGGKTYHLYWGSKECVWNNKGGDIASLIKYILQDHVTVPEI